MVIIKNALDKTNWRMSIIFEVKRTFSSLCLQTVNCIIVEHFSLIWFTGLGQETILTAAAATAAAISSP